MGWFYPVIPNQGYKPVNPEAKRSRFQPLATNGCFGQNPNGRLCFQVRF